MLYNLASVNCLLPGTELLACLLATALPCSLHSPPPVPVPCGTPVVHAGRCRTHRGTLPTLPCPPFTRPPSQRSPQTGRPTDCCDWGEAQLQLSSSQDQDNNVLPSSSSCPPALFTCHNRQVKTRPPVASWGPETWQMGYVSRPRAGKMEQHSSPPSGTLALWVILPASAPPAV